MKNGLKESGRRWTGKSSNEYYYRFLEQVVNVTARKVQSGMIDPETDFTEEEKEAYNIIAEKVLSFYENNEGDLAALSTTAISQQTFVRKMLSNGAADSIAGLGAGSAAFSKKAAENAKEAAFDLMIYETRDQAMVFSQPKTSITYSYYPRLGSAVALMVTAQSMSFLIQQIQTNTKYHLDYPELQEALQKNLQSHLVPPLQTWMNGHSFLKNISVL